jgi:periplasmic nitrate reductase NapD
MNISSIVIQVKSEFIEELSAKLQKCDFCDYHFHDGDKGKIIVTVEGENIDEEMAKVRKIEELEHVISADMMMSYSEDELDLERDKLLQSSEVPAILDDESLDAKDITYYGDLKKKL